MSFSNDFNGQPKTQPSVNGGNAFSDLDSGIDGMAQAIEENTKNVTNAIMERKQHSGQTSKVMLGMGELHEEGLHVLQQISILDSLQRRGLYCATALEWPANNIDLHIEEIFKPETTDKAGLISMLGAGENTELRNSLSADTTPIRSANARLSRALLHEFMDNRNIPAFCTDAPRDWDQFIQNQRKFQHLHVDDPKVADAVKDAMRLLNLPDDPTSVPPIDSLRQLGMLARNIYIINEAERILEEHPEIDVVLIEAGRAHVTGNDTLKPEPSPYEHSMSSLVAMRSEHVFVGAPLYSSQEDRAKNISPQALADPRILDLDYLEKTPFNANSSKTSDLNEAKQLQALAAHFPFIGQTLAGRTPLELYNQRKEALKNDLRGLSDNNGFTLAAPDSYIPT